MSITQALAVTILTSFLMPERNIKVLSCLTACWNSCSGSVVEEVEPRLWDSTTWGWSFYVCVGGPHSDLTSLLSSSSWGGGQFRRGLNWVFSIKPIELGKGGHPEGNGNGIKALLGLQSSPNLFGDHPHLATLTRVSQDCQTIETSQNQHRLCVPEIAWASETMLPAVCPPNSFRYPKAESLDS